MATAPFTDIAHGAQNPFVNAPGYEIDSAFNFAAETHADVETNIRHKHPNYTCSLKDRAKLGGIELRKDPPFTTITIWASETSEEDMKKCCGEKADVGKYKDCYETCTLPAPFMDYTPASACLVAKGYNTASTKTHKPRRPGHGGDDDDDDDDDENAAVRPARSVTTVVVGLILVSMCLSIVA